MMVVSLLASSPKNGVEIMDGVDAMTRGWWRPSPGSVYPLLDRMTHEGTLKKRDDGRYELTEKAHTELEVSFGPRYRRPRTTDEVVTEMHSLVSYMEDLNRSGSQELRPHTDKISSLAKRLTELGRNEKSAKDGA
jgi:DNA-binding PadR family transcriptional regulator